MLELFQTSVFFGVFITLFTYYLGVKIKEKYKLAICNPLLISMVLIIVVLLIFNIDYDTYNQGASYISNLLTPATVCLAVPLYEKLELLKWNWKAVIVGIGSGVLSSLICIFGFAVIFKMNHQAYVTLLPKSITTAIGMGVSEELGGFVAVTVVSIVITGIIGNICGEWVCKLCKITEPIAKGVAMGTASHAMGTAKAMEMGEIEGAMSSLSIVVAGILTVVGANIFAIVL